VALAPIWSWIVPVADTTNAPSNIATVLKVAIETPIEINIDPDAESPFHMNVYGCALIDPEISAAFVIEVPNLTNPRVCDIDGKVIPIFRGAERTPPRLMLICALISYQFPAETVTLNPDIFVRAVAEICALVA
jgi:hypothetical protein